MFSNNKFVIKYVKPLPKEIQETIQGILQLLDTEYGTDRNR